MQRKIHRDRESFIIAVDDVPGPLAISWWSSRILCIDLFSRSRRKYWIEQSLILFLSRLQWSSDRWAEGLRFLKVIALCSFRTAMERSDEDTARW